MRQGALSRLPPDRLTLVVPRRPARGFAQLLSISVLDFIAVVPTACIFPGEWS